MKLLLSVLLPLAAAAAAAAASAGYPLTPLLPEHQVLMAPRALRVRATPGEEPSDKALSEAKAFGEAVRESLFEKHMDGGKSIIEAMLPPEMRGVEPKPVEQQRRPGEYPMPLEGAECFGRAPWNAGTADNAAKAAYLSERSYQIGAASTEHATGVVKLLDGFRVREVHEPRGGGVLANGVGAFMAVREGDTLWFAFRGTQSIADAMHDAMAVWQKVELQVAFAASKPLGSAHAGFMAAWRFTHFNSFYHGVLQREAASPEGAPTRVRFTGHSLGGALAQIAALEAHLVHGGPVPEVYTFGSPRVGDAVFAGHLREHSTHFRYHNDGDPVPGVPMLDAHCTMLKFASSRGSHGPAMDLLGYMRLFAGTRYHARECEHKFVHASSAGASVQLSEGGERCDAVDVEGMPGLNLGAHSSVVYVSRAYREAERLANAAGRVAWNGGSAPSLA